MADEAPDRLLRLAVVIPMVGLSKAMIYRKIRAGSFPQPYKPGGVASRWSEREVVAWLEGISSRRVA